MRFSLSLAWVFILLFVAGLSGRAEGMRLDEYRLWLETGETLRRSGSLGEQLTWVIVRDGEIVLQRGAHNELSYTYFNNLPGSEYFVYLQKWGGSHYVRVSNIVGYRPGLASKAPIITSLRAAVAVRNTPFRYMITATGEPTRFSAKNLPPGLVLDEQGVISGTPTQTGNFLVTLTATAGPDTGTAALALSVVTGVNEGGLTSRYTLVLDSAYALTWNQGPAESGLNLIIKRDGAVVLGRNVLGQTHDSGYHANYLGGVFTVHLESSFSGSYRRVSNIVTYQPGAPVGFPSITSPLSAAGTLGVPLVAYQIVAQNSPVSFSATGLPSGLSVSPGGLISGVPMESGRFSVALSAANAAGTHRRTLTLTINASATPESLFTLTIDAGKVVRRSAGDLPGLCWVVREAGVQVLRRLVGDEDALLYFRAASSPGFTVHLESWLDGAYRRVSNTVGYHSAALVFIHPSRIVAQAGQRIAPFTLQLNAPHQTLTVGSLPDGLVRDGTVITGTPTTAGIYSVPLSASAGAANTQATLTIEVLPASGSTLPQARYSLKIDAHHTVTRSAGDESGLSWVVTRNGEVVLRRLASGEPSFTYQRNYESGEYTLHLEATVAGLPTRVSNLVGYATPSSTGAPIFASPRHLLLQAGRALGLQLLASDEPTSYSATVLPPGLTLSSAGWLSGTPSTAGVYAVTFQATRSDRVGSAAFTLEVLPSAPSTSYINRHRLSLHEDFTVSRTPGTDPNLMWVIRREGVELLSRATREELSYRHHANFTAGTYTIHLEAFLAGAYRIVSNAVSYTVGAGTEDPLLRHALGAGSGGVSSYLEPKIGSARFDDGRPALALTYTVNLLDRALLVTLEQSSNLTTWTPVNPVRRILAGDETFELREDLLPIVAGPPRFYRVRIDRAAP